MTVVVSQKQRIFYRFEGEKGAYLLLHHGLFGSHQDWYDAGYVAALRDEFRLIVMDARGHGRSDRPLDPAQYSLATLVDDVVAVMDELEIRNLHFFGYSLGALVGFEFLMRHPERVRIVMLGGESPFLSPEVQTQWSQLADEIARDGFSAVRQRMLERQELAGTPPEEQEGDALAAQALLRALAQETPRPDEGRISVDSPVALFTGEDDPGLERMREARRRIHRARFVSVPGRTRTGLFTERETLIAEIVRLLRPGRRDDGQREESGARGGRGERGPRQGRGRGRGRGQQAGQGSQDPGANRPREASGERSGEGANEPLREAPRESTPESSRDTTREFHPMAPPPPVEVPERAARPLAEPTQPDEDAPAPADPPERRDGDPSDPA